MVVKIKEPLLSTNNERQARLTRDGLENAYSDFVFSCEPDGPDSWKIDVLVSVNGMRIVLPTTFLILTAFARGFNAAVCAHAS